MKTLGEDFPLEQARCRKLLATYRELGQMPGVFVGFAIASIEATLKAVDEAAISGDVVAMLRAYKRMKEHE